MGFESYAYKVIYISGRTKVYSGFCTMRKAILAAEKASLGTCIETVVLGSIVNGQFTEQI